MSMLRKSPCRAAACAVVEPLESRLLLSGDGLSALIFDNANLTGTNVTRVDTTVNFNWGSNSPATGIGADTFSIRWAGQLETVEAGTYTFQTVADDGVRLWVDDVLVIDQWAAAGTYTGTVTLPAASKVHIVMEYYDNTGSASAVLNWKRPGQGSFSVVPQANLYSGQMDLPTDVGYINVKDYGAVGDGITDDSVAIRNAVTAGRGKLLYFPNGTYLVGEGYTLGTDLGTAKYTILQGQNRDNTVLKLMDADADFQSTSTPKALFSFFDGSSTGQAFRNAVYDMTFNVGKDNPGAIGLKHTANNQGGIRHVTVRAEASTDGVRRGVNGLDFTVAWPGPSIVRDVLVEGFNTGIKVGNYQYSLTFDDITLQQQNVKAVENYQNVLMFRKLTSRNSVPAYSDAGGEALLVLIDSDLTGGASGNTAILEKGECLIRNTVVSGYGLIVDNTQSGMTDVTNAAVLLGEYSNAAPVGAWTDRATTGLNLPIAETPDADYDPASNWVKVENVTGDDTQSIRNAIATANAQGKTTLYFTRSTYTISDTIEVTGGIKHMIGMECSLDPAGALETSTNPVFRFTSLTSSQIIFERFSDVYPASNATHVWIENNTDKTLVLKSLKLDNQDAMKAYVNGAQGTGDVFIEDVVGSRWFFGNGQNVWARQLNVECDSSTNVINDGANLWIMGLKTEYGQTNTDTRNGGKTELLGGFFYPAGYTVPADRPSNIITDAQASFTYAEAGSNRYTLEVRETRNGVTQDYTGNPYWSMPLYIGYPSQVTLPSAPSALGATTVSSTQINLAWTDNASNETGFVIERKTGSGGTWAQVGSAAANATSYSDTGLTPGTQYYYRVAASNSAGNSSYSNEANATTTPVTGLTWSATEVSRTTTNYYSNLTLPTADLTSVGTTDWVYWTRSGSTLSEVNSKSGGDGIGALTASFASDSDSVATGKVVAKLNFTDGTSPASGTNVDAGAAWTRSDYNADPSMSMKVPVFSFTAPVSAQTNTLHVWFAALKGTSVRMTAWDSGGAQVGSAVDASIGGNMNTGFHYQYEFGGVGGGRPGAPDVVGDRGEQDHDELLLEPDLADG